MKRKPADLSLEDQALTREILLSAAREAVKHNSIDQFIENLLTPSEQIMMGRRLWIARMLLEGKQLDTIGERLLVGPNTVKKVERQLLGEVPDYGETIKKERRKQTLRRRAQNAKNNPFGLTALKQKYPLHFIFFPWPK